MAGDKKSGKSSDGRGTYRAFQRAALDGDDPDKPVGTPSLGGYGGTAKSTVVEEDGNAAAVGPPTEEFPRPPTGELPRCRGETDPAQTAPWPTGPVKYELLQKPRVPTDFHPAYGGGKHSQGPNQSGGKNKNNQEQESTVVDDRTPYDTPSDPQSSWGQWTRQTWYNDDANKGRNGHGSKHGESGGWNNWNKSDWYNNGW